MKKGPGSKRLADNEVLNKTIYQAWQRQKNHRKVFYANLLTSGKLNSYLVDIDR